MKRLFLGAAACCALSAGNASAQGHPAPTETVARLDAIFAEIGAGGPGCATGIYRDGRPLIARGYGLANVELGAPITASTVFDIGSVSKQFTAMAIVLLADDGALSLDDDIRRFLPEIRDHGTRITVRHLIHHTSGIPDFLNLMLIRGQDERDGVSLPEIFDLLARQDRLMFTPGSRFSYSNSGYVLLAEIVARVSRQPFSAFAEKRIFKPLGMTSTHVHDDAGRPVPGRASAYHADPAKGLVVGGSNFALPGDGAVYTTVEDLQKWAADFDLGVVWTPRVKAEMLRPAFFPDNQRVGPAPGRIYAGGIGLGKYRGLDVIRHGGAWAGYVADLMRFPAEHLSISVLCNVDGVDPARFGNRIADLFLASRFSEPLRAPSTGAEESGPPADAVPVPPALLDMFAGRYHSDQIDADYVFRRNGGSLILEAGARRTRVDFAEMGAPLTLRGDATLVTPLFDLRLDRQGQGIAGFTLEMDRIGPVRFVRTSE